MGLRKRISLLFSKKHCNIDSQAATQFDSGSPENPPRYPLESSSSGHHGKINIFKRQEDVNESISLQRNATSSKTGDWKHYNERYTEIKLLAQGANGEVRLCRDNRSGAEVAVKTILREGNSVPNEVRILKILRGHDSIVRYGEFLNHPTNNLYQNIVMEYCPMGDLADYSEIFNDQIPEVFIWNVFKQISSGLAFVHSKGIVHGDLKLDNILVAPPHPGETWPLLKLADFGSSQINPNRKVPRAHTGAWKCTSPESYRYFGPETDVWAIGALVHMLALGKDPTCKANVTEDEAAIWFAKHVHSIPKGTPDPVGFKSYCYWHSQNPRAPQRIDRLGQHALFDKPTRCSKMLNYFMMRCLDMNYRSRISAASLARYVSALETFVSSAHVTGNEDLLDMFNDGRDPEWIEVSEVSDSDVIRQILFSLNDRARMNVDDGILKMGTALLQALNLGGFVDAAVYPGDIFNASRI